MRRILNQQMNDAQCQMSLQKRIFDTTPSVRYVALYRDGDLSLHQRDDISNASDSGSDRFEELLVNPTILKLVTQRGDIDCGGLDYILIRYGNFFQFVRSIGNGHVSVAIEDSADVLSVVNDIRTVLEDL